jgi:hypothetical protein
MKNKDKFLDSVEKLKPTEDRNIYLKEKIDPERNLKLKESKQDKLLADLRKREQTPVIKDTSLSTKDSWKVHSPAEIINPNESVKLKSGKEFLENIAEKRAQRKLTNTIGKKIAGIIPMAGTLYGLASGDPAMAAEQAVGDIPVVGQAAEALASDSAGMSAEDENMMLAEEIARRNYAKSPSSKARLAALKEYK